MPYIGQEPSVGGYELLTISGTINGSNTSFTLSKAPATANHLMLIINGVLQIWGTGFTVSGTTLTTTSAPASGSVMACLMLGSVYSAGQPSDGTVALASMADNSIDSDQYVDGSIDTAHLAADAITGAKIADDAIDSEHYTDGSIDTAHLAADAITGAKIADDAIDSEHYTDGSIDTAHLAADAVTGAKIADDAIDSEHYTDGSIDLAHMASQSVDEDNLYISNAGSNGQFLSKQSGNSGGLTWATAGGGKVLQVVWDEGSGGALDTSSTTYVDTTAAANITAASSSNKVLVIVTAPVYKGGQNDTNISWTLGLHRDISGGSSDTLLHEVWMGEGIGANGLSRAMFCTFTYLDSPSTTSQLTYQVVFKTGGTQLSVFPGETITLMEIEV